MLVFKSPLGGSRFPVYRGHSLTNAPADGCDEDTHQRTDEVEEAIRQIGQRGHTENRRLRHAARVPGNEHGGDGR